MGQTKKEKGWTREPISTDIHLKENQVMLPEDVHHTITNRSMAEETHAKEDGTEMPTAHKDILLNKPFCRKRA